MTVFDSVLSSLSTNPKTDKGIILTVQPLGWILDGFNLWRNRHHQGFAAGLHSMPRIIRAMLKPVAFFTMSIERLFGIMAGL